MKILYKMILGFSIVILSIWVVEFFAVDTSKKALKKSIEESSVLLAVQIIDELDKNIFRRIEENQLYSKDMILQNSVLASNREFEKLDNIQAYINKKDMEWTSAPKESITPFMQKIINNALSKELKERKLYFKNKYGYDVFSELIVTNKYGANVAQSGKTTDYRQDDEEWWQTAKNERFYIHDIGYDESADVYAIDFGIRIEDKKGDFIGVMKVVLNIKELVNIIKGPELTKTLKDNNRAKRMLITKDGGIIYSIQSHKFLGKVPDEFLSNFKKDRTGSFIAEAITKEKGEKLFSYARSNFRGLDWILILEHETKEIFAPINKLRDGIFIIALTVTVFAILVSLLFSRSITKPVTKLIDAALKIGKGALDTKIEVESKDEIGLLAQTFNQMASSLDRDITERKRVEKALRESEQKYRTLFEESKDVIYISTPEGKFLDINPAGIELFGYPSKEEFLQINITHDLYISPVDREEFQKVLTRQGYAKDYEVVFRRKDGEQVTVLLTTTIVRDERGKIVAYRGIMKDITERKKLEEQLLQAQKMEAIGQLGGGIAHDFNNILTAIIGFGNLLKTEMKKDDPLRTYVTRILTSAERAANLTQALLAFSRRQIINPVPINLNNTIKVLENLLHRLIGEDIELSTILSYTDLIIMADSTQIEQVLMNLVTNARDAMPDGGSLTIKTDIAEFDNGFIKLHGFGKPGEYAIILVEDTGHGMDENTKEKIFEPFFTTKEVGKGTGLGLSMAYGIIKQHDGYINVYSETGRGTTFKIYLPLIKSKVKEATPADLLIIKGGKETVLVAEDDALVRELIKEVLSGYGYSVIEAGDGEETIRVFNENKDSIQLLILDVIMPKKNGKEVYDEIKEIKPDIKAIFTSGYTADIINKKGILEEGLEFILKPISPDRLLRTVREVLDK